MSRELPQRVEGERVIEAAPEAVWSVLSDFHAVDRWAPLVTDVQALGTVASGLGMARRCELRWLGSLEEVVNVWEPGRRIGYRVTPVGPVGESQSLWKLEPAGPGATRVRLELCYRMRFGAVGRLLDAAIGRRTLARNLRGALALLRRHVLSEGGGSSSASGRVPGVG